MTTPKVFQIDARELVIDQRLNPRYAGKKNPEAAANAAFKSDVLKPILRSFKQLGVTVPIMVTKLPDGRWAVRDGFTRAQWAQKNGITVNVQPIPTGKIAQTAAVAANVARVPHDPIARANTYRDMVRLWGSEQSAAKNIGVSLASLRETLRLLTLPAAVRKALRSRNISLASAQAVFSLPGWKAYRKTKTGKATPADVHEAAMFGRHVEAIVKAHQRNGKVSVAEAWNADPKTKYVATVMPSVRSIKNAGVKIGRRIAKAIIEGKQPKTLVFALECLGAAMGWTVPAALRNTIVTKSGKPLYNEALRARVTRETVAEFTLAGLIALREDEGRVLPANSPLHEDAAWEAFYTTNAALPVLVRKLDKLLTPQGRQ